MAAARAGSVVSVLSRRVAWHVREHKALPALVVLVIAASFWFDPFFTALNLKNVLRQVSMLGIVSIGMTLVMLTGGIDLSVGAVAAVAAILAAQLSDSSLTLALLVPLLAGLALGLLNGALVTRLKITPFIATLATMLGARGAAFVISGGETVRPSAPVAGFSELSRGAILEVPYLGILFVLAIAIFAVVLKYTPFGRRIYAVGGNEEAAKMMGLKVSQTKLRAYALSGLMAALAGVLLASRLGSGQPYAGGGWELLAIAAVVIGGTLTTGGAGSMIGTLYGVLIIGVITNMVNLFGNLPYWYSSLVTAALLLGVILLQSVRGAAKPTAQTPSS
jgi:ribose/xylose/arabinose/galactoside ABC-type transport system permease subunit